jgi:hypothetical protein
MTTDIDTGFEEAPESILQIYRDLVRRYDDVAFLARYNLAFQVRIKESRRKGKRVLGSATVCNKQDFQLHGFHAKIVLDYGFVDEHRDDPEILGALIYHELCHLEENEAQDYLVIADHDFAEFYRVILRFGDWTGEIQQARIQLERNLADSGQDESMVEYDD